MPWYCRLPRKFSSILKKKAWIQGMEVKAYRKSWNDVTTCLVARTSRYHTILEFPHTPFGRKIETVLSIYRFFGDPMKGYGWYSLDTIFRQNPYLFQRIENIRLETLSTQISPAQFRDKALAYLEAAEASRQGIAPYYRSIGGDLQPGIICKAQKVHPWPHNPDAVHLVAEAEAFPPKLVTVIQEIAAARSLEMIVLPERWGLCEIELMGRTDSVTWDVVLTCAPRLGEIGVSLFAYGWTAVQPPEWLSALREATRLFGKSREVKTTYRRLTRIDRDPFPADISPESFREELLVNIGRIEGYAMGCTGVIPPPDERPVT